MAKHDALFVRYCAKDFLDGTQTLGPWEELAYRRICDLIYATGNRLPDDDRRMAWMTKVGKRWRSVKSRLIALGKISVDDDFIRNERCSLEVGIAGQKRASGAMGGTATSRSGKSLKNLKRGPKQAPKQTPKRASEAETEANHLTTYLEEDSVGLRNLPIRLKQGGLALFLICSRYGSTLRRS